MKKAHAAAILAALAITSCGGGGSESAGTVTGGDNSQAEQILQRVLESRPQAQWLSVGGLDSTYQEWESLRTTPATIDVGCNVLLGGLLIDRGSFDQTSGDRTNPFTVWYWDQGYVARFAWSASDNCAAEDFRFEISPDNAMKAELQAALDALSTIEAPAKRQD